PSRTAASCSVSGMRANTASISAPTAALSYQLETRMPAASPSSSKSTCSEGGSDAIAARSSSGVYRCAYHRRNSRTAAPLIFAIADPSPDDATCPGPAVSGCSLARAPRSRHRHRAGDQRREHERQQDEPPAGRSRVRLVAARRTFLRSQRTERRERALAEDPEH